MAKVLWYLEMQCASIRVNIKNISSPNSQATLLVEQYALFIIMK
jgi:hypothetical protein